MTVVVAFLCADGIVVAADSMLTPSMGNINVGHHHGVKVHVLRGPQLFAFAGDQGQSARFQVLADLQHASAGQGEHPINYALSLSQGIVNNFLSTGLTLPFNLNAVLGFIHADAFNCCIFEGAMQPRLLDHNHYYAALGVGKLSADPFLRFLTDIFCKRGLPNVREAIFLSAWVVQHVIDTNPGGVAGPIRMGVFERHGSSSPSARLIPETEIEETMQAIEGAEDALLQWHKNIQTVAAARGVPPPPPPPRTN